MNQFDHYPKDTTVGAPVASGNLAMFPLYRAEPSDDSGPKSDIKSDSQPDSKPIDCLCFDDAMEKDWVSVTEVNEVGSVPTLLLDNRAS